MSFSMNNVKGCSSNTFFGETGRIKEAFSTTSKSRFLNVINKQISQ